MATAIEQLEEILKKEITLADEFRLLLEEKQQAIIHLQTQSLDDIVAREHQLLRPMQHLENERNKAVLVLIPEQARPTNSTLPLRKLLAYLPTEDAKIISGLGKRLSENVEHILNYNRRLKILLNQSLHFVRETVGILTDNYSKQLIDKKM